VLGSRGETHHDLRRINAEGRGGLDPALEPAVNYFGSVDQPNVRLRRLAVK